MPSFRALASEGPRLQFCGISRGIMTSNSTARNSSMARSRRDVDVSLLAGFVPLESARPWQFPSLTNPCWITRNMFTIPRLHLCNMRPLQCKHFGR